MHSAPATYTRPAEAPATATLPAPAEPFEYRVSWRREEWSASTWTKHRTFGRWRDAARFLRRLLGDGRPDLSGVCELAVHRRRVGAWSRLEAETWRVALEEGGQP